MMFVAPSRAEQQLIDFFVNGAASNDVTNPAFGGPQTNFQTGGFATYFGPGQGQPNSTIVLPGGFQTTSSGPGAVSEGSNRFNHGTHGGHVVNGHTANDAYDGYGGIGFRQGGAKVADFAGLAVRRQVEATHGPSEQVTPITAAFTKAGVPNAVRWVDTISNPTNATVTGTFGYFNNLGSDNNTRWVGSSSGNHLATTGNTFLTSIQNSPAGNDPVITHVLGNNAYAKTQLVALHANGDDNPEWDYPVTAAPGQTKIVVLFNVATADINFDPANPASDIALGATMANIITNNGNPISPEDPAFALFSDFSVTQLKEIINYDFVGLTIDMSRAFFIETDFAAKQSPATFDGGTLKPTQAWTFSQPFILDAPGGTVDDSNGNVTFSNVISGSGPLTIQGANKTILTAANTYTGPTTVESGTLVVNGSIANSIVTLENGGTLGGNGTVGGLSVQSGGIVAPGNSIGVLNVAGNIQFQAGSVYQVQADSNGGSDKIVATGTATLSGGSVQVLSAPGAYAASTRYTILTANGGVSGAFSSVTSDLAFLTPTLSYDATDAFLTLTRAVTPSGVVVTFPSGAKTPNQRAAATAAEALGPGNGVFNAILGLTAAQAPAAFDALSGEIHASAVSGAFEDSRLPREAVLDRLMGPYGALPAPGMAGYSASADMAVPARMGRGYVATTAPVPASVAIAPWAFWGQAFGGVGRLDGDGNAAKLDRSLAGFILGADVTPDPHYRIGAVAGYTESWLKVNARASSGTISTVFGGVYGGATFGPVRLRGGAIYAGDRFDTSRTSSFPGFSDVTKSGYDGSTAQLFGEAGYRFDVGRYGIEPFVGALGMNIHTDSFTESGGAAALHGGSRDFNFGASTLGLRTESALFANLPLVFKGMIGWRHVFGDVTPDLQMAFATAPGTPFTIAGAPIARDALVSETGLDWRVNPYTTAGIYYSSEWASKAADNTVKGKLEIEF